MNIIDVTYSRMREARQQLLSESEEYKKGAGRITVAAAELWLQWEGDAGKTFEAEQREAIAFYNTMAERIARCANALGKAADAYAQADYAAADAIRSATR